MYRIHNKCRICSGEEMDEVLDLGLMPLANDFCDAHQEHSGYAPLKLLWCPRCTLAQLSVVVNPNILYYNYPYVTSKSQTMLEHFSVLTGDLMVECGKKSVVEIGSNDGTLLEYFAKLGFDKVVGIEPADNLRTLAKKRGIESYRGFFTEATALDVVDEIGFTDLVIARHVFCHIDNWHAAIHALGVLCGKDTVIAIEVPYFPDTIAKVEWDQVYHEHLSYMTIPAMQAALEGSMLHLSKVTHYPIHGGAIVMLLKRNDCGIQPGSLESPKVTLADLHKFAESQALQVKYLRSTVLSHVAEGKRVVGYGASAKSTQWIQACGFTRKQIKWVCDNTQQKQYKLMPGSDIPVVDEGALTRELPDYAICFAWNFAEEIMTKEKIFKAKGGKWIIPHGEIKIV